MNSATGELSWTPTAPQAQTLNRFKVSVKDDGSPNLSATQSLCVIVRPKADTPPIVASVLPQQVEKGWLLVVTNGAVDSDLPPQKLSGSPAADVELVRKPVSGQAGDVAMKVAAP